MENKEQIYHERQRLQFCLLHALNNLFQEKDLFSKAELNSISEKLVPEDPIKENRNWNPLSPIFKAHHNSLTGNYDINVLIAALEGKGKQVLWHDRRNKASSINFDSDEDRLMGFVLNIPLRKFGGIWTSRHWVAVRRIEGVWYNLDSDLVAPIGFKDTEELKDFLDYIISKGGEILLVLNNTNTSVVEVNCGK